MIHLASRTLAGNLGAEGDRQSCFIRYVKDTHDEKLSRP